MNIKLTGSSWVRNMDYEMTGLNVVLNEADRAILESYKFVCEGLAKYLGTSYEVVLHSLEDCSHSAIKVINGFHTGRKEGAPITDLAISMLSKIKHHDGSSKTGIVYFTNNRRGEPLKSTTIPIYDPDERVIGLLCINFCLNAPFSELIKTFSKPDTTGSELVNEYFSDNMDDLIVTKVHAVRSAVYADVTISATNKNKEIVRRLDEQGIFKIKESISKTARILNISKNTIYLHLRNTSSPGAPE